MRRRIRLWLLLALPALVVCSTDGEAIVCGADVCEVAGNVNGSPLVVGDSGNFATSVDAVNDTLVGKPPENSGDSYAHAWQFALTERANVTGTLTKNNTLPTFSSIP
jgi:hypothetical protein